MLITINKLSFLFEFLKNGLYTFDQFDWITKKTSDVKTN